MQWYEDLKNSKLIILVVQLQQPSTWVYELEAVRKQMRSVSAGYLKISVYIKTLVMYIGQANQEIPKYATWRCIAGTEGSAGKKRETKCVYSVLAH